MKATFSSRRFSFSILILSSLAVVAFLFSGGAEPPYGSRVRALEKGKQALQARADLYAPDEYRQYRYSFRRAARFQMEEDIRLFPFLRDYTGVLEAFRHAQKLGEEARQASLDKQAELTDEIQDVLDQTREQRDQIRELINGVSLGRTSGSSLAEADILLTQAEKLIQMKEYEKARIAAIQANSKLGSVQNRADRALVRLQSKDLLTRWAQWVESAVSWSRENNDYSVVIDKSRHVCMVFRSGSLVRSFPVNLGVNGFNQKIASGDCATPEGQYYVVRKQGVGYSRYYKGLMLNYPNEQDRQRFQQAKSSRQISASAHIGGNIMLHGEGGKDKDWTLGCVALSNQDMDTLFDLAQVNTPVTIVGRVSGRFSLANSSTHDIVEKTKELQNRKKQIPLL